MLTKRILFALFIIAHGLYSQDIQYFTVEDFELKGSVQSCITTTPYGKESFAFNEAGQLTQTVTQYNDTDRDITYYRYQYGELVEKRTESYKDQILDATTSLASFYTIYKKPKKRIIEKIISYDKTLLEQREYLFDAANRLLKVITTNAEGVDETTLEYIDEDDEYTTRIFVNRLLAKSVKTYKKTAHQSTFNCILTKTYIEGIPHRATEAYHTPQGKLYVQKISHYDPNTGEFTLDTQHHYHYDAEGILQKVITKTNNTTSVQEYNFQYDTHPQKNWIKKIVTPKNTYITRSITYYP